MFLGSAMPLSTLVFSRLVLDFRIGDNKSRKFTLGWVSSQIIALKEVEALFQEQIC